MSTSDDPTRSVIGRLIGLCLANRLLVVLAFMALAAWGMLVAPFDWQLGSIPRDPVPVDAIPDIGENQQIVFTHWAGRSPRDVEDQVTYPLTAALLGIPKVRTVRSVSYFGFSTIYLIFEEGAEFYWSRSRVLEKLNSLPTGTLPEGVVPRLGPDATALGQVFWYTLEGRDAEGQIAPGWDLQELRSIQDFQVRYALQAVEGVAEVASVGGHVKEYQIDVDPDAMQAYGVTLPMVFNAVKMSNLDVGARTIEINRVEYMLRGIGLLQSIEDLRQVVVKTVDNVPVTLDQIATVHLGPAPRRGALDKEGAEVVGGVVVVRHGVNPLATLQRLQEKIEAIAPSLPEKQVGGGRISRVTIVPFYDRSELIYETLGTLESALSEELLITIIVVMLILLHFRSSILVSLMLPLAILLAFIAMKLFHVDANIVALSGIAIAIGTMVDMGIVLGENILRHIRAAEPEAPRLPLIHRASSEVGGAVLTAVLTTVIGFLPVFAMVGAEGKLFRPLAFTKTFALAASILLALTLLPVLARTLFSRRLEWRSPPPTWCLRIGYVLVALAIGVVLARNWEPLGPEKTVANLLFVVGVIGGFLLFFVGFLKLYPRMLGWCLRHKAAFLVVVGGVLLFGLLAWRGMDGVFGFAPERVRNSAAWQAAAEVFPGLGQEFMPALDEGSFLFMPSTMSHASFAEAQEVLALQDQAIRSIPEVEQVVGKMGRAESPLDPAPISMFETIIHYKPEYMVDADGHSVRQWRDHIRSPDDIWREIVDVSRVPGTTSAPKLQPIAARLVMLQSGMRAPMGIKVYGPDLQTIDAVGLELERHLKQVPSIDPTTVFADRMVGKPYLELEIDRTAISRHGLQVQQVQQVIQVAIGGRRATTTVEGRERYPVRIRYQRERRDDIDLLGDILVPTPAGARIPLRELTAIRYVRGPMMIKSEDTFLVGYVIFDKREGEAEVDVVEEAERHLQHLRDRGALQIPAGVGYHFTGTYEHQVRAEQKLMLIAPLALLLIFMLLYLQFKRVSTTLLVFSGIFVASSGGFILLWLYGQDWFLTPAMRELFQVGPVNLSVAVWVGFLALFGIATDDGVLMGTYLEQRFRDRPPTTREEVRQATVEAATRRNRAAVMTTVTTLLALFPVLTSTGRGSDIMVPMAIPTFGGEALTILTVFVVPTLYCWLAERRLRREGPKPAGGSGAR